MWQALTDAAPPHDPELPSVRHSEVRSHSNRKNSECVLRTARSRITPMPSIHRPHPHSFSRVRVACVTERPSRAHLQPLHCPRHRHRPLLCCAATVHSAHIGSSGTSGAMSALQASAGEESLSTHRAVLASILAYLSSLKQSPLASSLLVSVDSLDAALDCLSEATALPPPAAADSAQSLPLAPSLVAIYQAGVAALSPSAAAPSSQFSQFVGLLTARGFFAGCEAGSAAYADRLAAAQQKYDDKYGAASASTSAASERPAASSDDRRLAEQLKAEGNTYLASQQFEQAVKRYSEAIELNPRSAIYFGNRAAAHISLHNWTDAENDCRDAINLDPHYGKGQPPLHCPHRTHCTAATTALCCTAPQSLSRHRHCGRCS